MRKYTLFSVTVFVLVALGMAITGPASAQAPRSDHSRSHPTHRIVVAMRTPNILV